jgi:hypothetical protein
MAEDAAMSFVVSVKTTRPPGTFASCPAKRGRVEEGVLSNPGKTQKPTPPYLILALQDLQDGKSSVCLPAQANAVLP